MPTYLLHGFRWQRPQIRIHIILHDLEDAAPEWIMAPATSVTLLNNFYSLYDFLPPSNPPPASYSLAAPSEEFRTQDKDYKNGEKEGRPRTLSKRNKESIASLSALGRKKSSGGMPRNEIGSGIGHLAMRSESEVSRTVVEEKKKEKEKEEEKKPTFNDWSVVKFIEQYDPNDLQSTSQPYAYVADYMLEVPLGVSITDEISQYEARQRAEEIPLSPISPTPLSPGTPLTPAGRSGVGATGDLASPTLSAREIRRKSRRLGWFEKLRDGVQKGADIGWFVVVCGDEERALVSMETERTEDQVEEDGEEKGSRRKGTGLKGLFNKRKIA